MNQNPKRLIIILLVLVGVSTAVLNSKAQKPATSISQKIIITGNVKDNLNNNLKGVVVTNLTTDQKVLTNENGNFQMEATKGDSLSASFVGFTTYKWQFRNQLDYSITLTPFEGSLNDVAIVGFGRQKKITLVGAQSSVNVEELKQPVANLNTMLAGRISGVVGVQRSGLPGSNSADIWIRGISTFGDNGSTPLIIVDGVQGRSINDFDPEDVESFTVLKDATATAVYGALGANGVIIINTKRGKIQKVNLMANYLEGITNFTKVQQMADAATYMTLKNEALVASGEATAYSQDYIDSTLSPTANHYVYPNVDWMGALFNKNSHNRRLNFSATGGTESIKYYSSVAYYEESSLLKTDHLQDYDAATRFQRFNFVSNVDMKWSKTTKFSLGITGYISELQQPGNGAVAAFASALDASPVRIPVMYPDNLVSGAPENGGASPNPYAIITQSGYQKNFAAKIASTVRLEQDLGFITKGLSANAQYTFDTYSSNSEGRTRQRNVYYLNQSEPYNEDGSLNLEQIVSGSDILGFGSNTYQSRQFSLQSQLAWGRSFGHHSVNTMIVYSQLSQPNPTAGSYQDAIPDRQQNYATRTTYSYKDKYLAEFDGGYTGSQVFSPKNRYGFFPSLGVGWVVSNESFWKPLQGVFQFFKLRYSNGYSGAIGGTRFDYLSTIGDALGIDYGNSEYNVHYAGINVQHYGTDVRWAKSHDQDLGLEFKILNSHLSFVVDWFQKYRTGIFLTRDNFPGFAGLQYQPDGNYGITLNRGIDGTIEMSPVAITSKFSMSFRGTLSYNKAKLLENGAAPYEEPYMDPRGQNLNLNYGFIAEGLFQSQEQIDNHPDQSSVGGKPRPGDIMYKDLNADGVINVYDQTYIGQGSIPPLTFGLGINFNYDRFYLSAFFQGVQGAERFLDGVARSPFFGSDDNNIYANTTSRWTEENPDANSFYPRLGYGHSANANNNVTSTWWKKDVSFVRFKTLNMGYNLPNKVFKHTGFRDARIYFDAVNLFYWSPFKLWDPELGNGSGNSYPNTRNLAIGFQVHF